MNREDIIRMADQSEIDPYDMCEDHRVGVHRLMAFAALVAAAEREAIDQSLDKQADLACDDIDRQWAQEMAAAVRARGETK